MLSLHPQDINNNPCFLPYRSLAAPSSIHADSPSFMSFNMGGAVQHPPTPQQDRLDTDGLAPSPRTSPSAPCSPHQRRASPTPHVVASSGTISPPADYHNLDPNTVAEALEVARDSPDGARDPVVSGILESALSQIWERVLASPESYTMTTGEFAVFNFYQHRFLGNKIAVAARRRYWDNTYA